MTAPLLEICGLSVSFRRGKAVTLAAHDVSFDVATGETVGLVGESGSGKSTIARAVVGLAPVQSGSVRFRGEEISRLDFAARRRLYRHLQLVFQDPYSSLNPSRTVGRTLAEPLQAYGERDRARVQAQVRGMLDRVQLPAETADRYPGELSGGQRQRVAIARALMLSPQLVILDEPLSALDRRPGDRVPTAVKTGELDAAEFTELINSALYAPPASAVRKLATALALVRGRPLLEVSGESYARVLTRRLSELQETARRELIHNHMVLGRHDLALPVAERMAEERPDDPAAADVLGALRTRLRERHGDELLRHTMPGLHTDVVVVRGDLFDQSDANLVVGFTDTFDTSTDQDYVISSESVQGQLVDRFFGGRPQLLDEKLRLGLKGIASVGTERAQDKPRGRRTRYPIGTTVPLPIGGRRVFATAYSRLGNDLVARSGPADLRASLEELWRSVARHGLFKPVAIPLVGSGLARIVDLDRSQLMALIIETFARGCRSGPPVAPELRIVIRPAELAKTDLSAVERYLQVLGRGRSAVGGSQG